MIEVKLRGFEEARRALRAMPERIQKNVMRGATAAIAKDTRDDARARAPVDEGNLRDNIVHGRRRGRPGQIKASVSVRTEGKADSGKNAFYWRFVEYGTQKMAKIPFLRPAFDALATRLSAVLQRYLPARVEKELRKLAGMPKR